MLHTERLKEGNTHERGSLYISELFLTPDNY
jgi:hypothetical protein